jgi:hypothetical protein
MRRLIRILTSSKTLVAGVGFAFSGTAFAVGNILLARQMPIAEFGHFALGVAIFIIFSHIAPLGIDQLFLRRRIDPSPKLFVQLLAQGVAVAIVVGIGAHNIFDLPVFELFLVGLSITFGNLLWSASAGLRRHGKPFVALGAETAPDWTILATGIICFLIPIDLSMAPNLLYCGGVVVSSLIIWTRFSRNNRVSFESSEPNTRLAAVHLLGITSGGVIIVQLERLLIPLTLDLNSLALFNVLASVAIFPFRMVTAGAGFALVPRLRAAPDKATRRALVRHELVMVGLALVTATVVVSAAAPFAARWLTGGRYQPELLLVLAACINGTAKVGQMLTRAVISACGTERDVTILNGLVWTGIFAGALGAVIGSSGGLGGLLSGVAAGSLVSTVPLALLAYRTIERGN